jgi:glycosyltransferase involved in cell wall biosynthesis
MAYLKVLIIGYVWPETNASAAGLRDWAILEHCLKQGWEVLYVSPAKENAFSEKIQKLGVRIFSCQANDSRFDDFILEVSPDVVVFDRFVTEEQFGWRVSEHAPEALRIVDTQDLHFLRRSRQLAFEKELVIKKDVDLEFFRKFSEDTFLREMSSLLRSDHVFVLSSFEQKILTSLGFPEESMTLLRFSYPHPPQSLPSFENRKHFVTIGNFRHPPNADAVLFLHQQIWPKLRLLSPPGTELHIYGAYPAKEMMSLDDPETGFRVKGPAPDQYKTLEKYRVLLAPLRFGAGIKGKISDAWWSGTPVVTSAIGAEGMMSSPEFPGLWISQTDPLSDFISEFNQAALSIYGDFEKWHKTQSQGFEVINEEYSFARNQTLLTQKIASLKQNQAKRRSKDWLGAMLSTQLMRSTKYFSKWIEAKNQNA